MGTATSGVISLIIRLELVRYLLDAEYREAGRKSPRLDRFPYASALRSEISARNIEWTTKNRQAHEISMGTTPSVLYREDDMGNHGNFMPATYRRIQGVPEWKRRLKKVHTTARRALLSRDPNRCELDSCNSSDALLMNIFCHPGTLPCAEFRSLLGVQQEEELTFGYRPRAPLLNGQCDRTEVDLKIGDLLIEAKLTERDFQTASIHLVAKYVHFEEVFDTNELRIENGLVPSYQLIRSALAAYAVPGRRFCVVCDRRRPDLIDAWHRVLAVVKPYDLRGRLQLVTWQELTATLPASLREFLYIKYGLRNSLG